MQLWADAVTEQGAVYLADTYVSLATKPDGHPVFTTMLNEDYTNPLIKGKFDFSDETTY